MDEAQLLLGRRYKTGPGPGPGELIHGDMNLGYFGRYTPGSEFITPASVPSFLGVNAGSAGISPNNWLKFALNGKVLYVSRLAVRVAIGWNSISSANAVNGSRIVTINDASYRVRLLTGWNPGGNLNQVPSGVVSATLVNQSEFNKLLGPVNNGGWDNLSGAELNFSNNGQTWCQENTSTTALLRGVNQLNDAYMRDKTDSTTYRGWRVVLELFE